MSTAELASEFYVGAEPKAPRATSLFVMEIVVVASIAIIAIPFVFFLAMRPAPAGFASSAEVELQGVLQLSDVPTIYVVSPTAGGRAASEYLLVGEGKRHLPDALYAHDGKKASVRGTVYSRGGLSIIEVAEDAWQVLGEPTREEIRPRAQPRAFLGLQGEVTSAKCYLGWMKPGHGKTHRACSMACLYDDMPGLMVVRTGQGLERVVALAPPQQRGVGKELAFRAGRPVYVQGQLYLQGDIPVFVPQIESLRTLYYQSLFLD